jgi:hypothetical protein
VVTTSGGDRRDVTHVGTTTATNIKSSIAPYSGSKVSSHRLASEQSLGGRHLFGEPTAASSPPREPAQTPRYPAAGLGHTRGRGSTPDPPPSTNSAQTWLPKNSSSALDEVPKPYYCGSKNHTSAPSLPRRPCLALHPCALPVHPPPTTAKASALASLMSGVANRSATSK